MSNIIGKDRDVEFTIDIVKKIFEKCGIHLEESNILNPVDGIWSVHLKDKDSRFYTNGKGSSKINAIASAYCEFLERFGSSFFFNDFYLGDNEVSSEFIYAKDEVIVKKSEDFKKKILNNDLLELYDTDNNLDFESFVDSSFCNNSDDIICLPFKIFGSSEITLFPSELLKNIFASNGLSAGNSEKETLIQGISECIERGVKNHIIREGLSLPNISKEFLGELGFMEIIQSIESFGYQIQVKDASLGGRFPVICVLLIDSNNGNILSSFGAHPNVKVGIERTLTELLQGRKLETLSDFSKISYNLDEVADEANIEAHFINSTGALHINLLKMSNNNFTLWENNSLDDLEFLKDLLKNEGYTIYYRTQEIDGMWVSQTLIPMLSEIYPEDDLEYEFKNRSYPIIWFLQNHKLSKKDSNKVVEWFEESYIDGNSNILDYIGVGTSQNEQMHNLLCYEAEIMLLIVRKEFDKIKDLIRYIDLENINLNRRKFLMCLFGFLNNATKYELSILYGEETFDLVKQSLSGLIPESLYPELKRENRKFDDYYSILDLYSKYQKLIN